MFWFIIGILLLLWVVYDLIKGEVWSYRKIERATEPIMYWLFILLWLVIAISCITPFLAWY